MRAGVYVFFSGNIDALLILIFWLYPLQATEREGGVNNAN